MICNIKRRASAGRVKPIFADNEWADIIAACQSGSVPETWAVGDSKPMSIGGASYQIDIIGKNHDTYTTGDKAPLTFQMHDCYGEKYRMNRDKNYYPACEMRTTYLPAILSIMPSEVQDGIREVNKPTAGGDGDGFVYTWAEKLFLPSMCEVHGSPYYGTTDGEQYEYYSIANNKIKYYNGSAADWWTRSPSSLEHFEGYFGYINSYGYPSNDFSYVLKGIAFAFCF